MPFYQCFKTIDRDTYCSSTRFRNHDEGAAWVKAAMEHFQIRANDMHGKPWESNDQPEKSIVWPED